MFSKVLSDRIEQHLGVGSPTILCEYPISEAALARPKPGDPRVAERFRTLCLRLELANAFGELTDPSEQRRRFVEDMDAKQRSMASAIRSMRISSPRFLPCRRPAASRLASTGL